MREPAPDLTDGAVLLRRWSDADLPSLAAAAQDPRIPAGTTVPAVPSDEAGRAFVRRQWSRASVGEGVSLAIVDRRAAGADAGPAVGACVLMLRPQAGVAGIGYWLVPAARGLVLASAAVRLLSSWALADAGLARVEALVEPGNAPSLRVLAAVGFEREGVLRSFLAFPDGRRSDAVVLSRVAG